MFSMDAVIHLVLLIESHVISEIPRVPVLLPLVLVAVAVVAALCGSRASLGSTLQATTSVRTGTAQRAMPIGDEIFGASPMATPLCSRADQ